MLKGGDTAGASVNVRCGSFRIKPTAGGDDKLSAGRSDAPGMLAPNGQTEPQFGLESQFKPVSKFGPYTITTLPRELLGRTASGSRCTVFTLRTPTVDAPVPLKLSIKSWEYL